MIGVNRSRLSLRNEDYPDLDLMRYGPGPGHWWDEFSDSPTAPAPAKHRWIFFTLYIILIIGVSVALYFIFAPNIGLSTPITGN